MSDAEFGCTAFGHLASPFVDGELAREERERFATHLDACRPCQSVVASYRALDVLARQPAPPVSGAQWERAWEGISAAIAADREAAASAPLASVARLSQRLGQNRRAWLRPLGYAAAAALLVALTLSLQRRWDVPGQGERQDVPRVAAGTPREGGSRGAQPASAVPASAPAPPKLMALTCQAPDFVPVVYTVAGEEPMTVVQCARVGPIPGASGPTEG